jgi:hypothetical protein
MSERAVSRSQLVPGNCTTATRLATTAVYVFQPRHDPVCEVSRLWAGRIARPMMGCVEAFGS